MEGEGVPAESTKEPMSRSVSAGRPPSRQTETYDD